jgi:transcriptional regulator GlxA family with amidase domain
LGAGGESGQTATCSNGASFRLDIGLDEMERDDVLLVCGGIDVQRATTRGILNWLRREARRGVTMGGLCTGAYALARAGLLDGRRPRSIGKTRTDFLRNSKRYG